MVRLICCALPFVLTVAGCGLLPLYSSTNVEYNASDYPTGSPPVTIASSTVDPGHRGRSDTLVILAFSGGGSRAAYLSAKVMFALEKRFYQEDKHILDEVDAISSVSGGSLPAAYFAVTKDPDDEGPWRLWNERKVLKAMQKNYIRRWFLNWFWPQNFLRYWLTDFDRTDIMAQTFADNMFDKRGFQIDYTIGELNPERPNLVLNATNATAGKVSIEHHEAKYLSKQSLEHTDIPGGRTSFGRPFRFTEEEFQQIHSDIRDYSLARAVMATAAFPAVFNYMTLRDYSREDEPEKRFVHLFDGGSSDNQGLSGVLQILQDSECKKNTSRNDGNCERTYEKVIVILVDAYTGTGGVNAEDSDGRSFVDFVLDTNFIDATDSLLFSNRDQRTSRFFEAFEAYLPASDKGIYYHITLEDVDDEETRTRAQNVGTNFSLSKVNAKALDDAVDDLMKPENRCLQAIAALLHHGHHDAEPHCKLPPRD